MLIRVRTNVGLWRVSVGDTATLAELKDAIGLERPEIVLGGQRLGALG